MIRPLALAAATVLLAACARDPRQALRGEWRSDTGRMVFYRDGQMLMEEGDSAASASMARYDFPDKRRLRIRTLAASPVEYTLQVTGDSLVLCRIDQPPPHSPCARRRHPEAGHACLRVGDRWMVRWGDPNPLNNEPFRR